MSFISVWPTVHEAVCLIAAELTMSCTVLRYERCDVNVM